MSAQSFLDGRVVLHAGDCRDVIKTLADNSIDAVVTDPPYALVSIQNRLGKPGSAAVKNKDVYARASAGFMGKQWDTGETAFGVEFWREIFRVLKPGGHVIAFAGTRTYHRLACAVEDAGFEIRDMITDLLASDTHVQRFMNSLNDEQTGAFLRCAEESQFGGMLQWLYGTGFPKSLDVSKAIDKAAGAKRDIIAEGGAVRRIIPGADQNKAGWEKNDDRIFVPTITAPATESAKQWAGFGTALKPACEPMVLARKPLTGPVAANVLAHGTGALNVDGCRVQWQSDADAAAAAAAIGFAQSRASGKSIQSPSIGKESRGGDNTYFPEQIAGRWPANVVHDGSGEVVAAFDAYCGPVEENPARFFYSAKADAQDRIGSKHPTIKPVDLMQWLVRLVTPPGGVVLDPFAGSGSTGEAAWREGLSAILVEREPDYQADIAKRMELAAASLRERKEHIARARPKHADPLPLFNDDGPQGGAGGFTACLPINSAQVAPAIAQTKSANRNDEMVTS